MESVGSRQGRSDFGDPGGHTTYESEQEDFRRPLMARAEVSMNPGPSFQRIRFSVVGEMNELNGRDRDEDRVRSWIRKVKSAFKGTKYRMKKNACCSISTDWTSANLHSQLGRATRRT